MTARTTATQPSGGDGVRGDAFHRLQFALESNRVTVEGLRAKAEREISGGNRGERCLNGWTPYGPLILDTLDRLATAERVVAAAKDVAHFWHDAPASPETCDKYIAALNTLRDTLAAAHPDDGGDDA